MEKGAIPVAQMGANTKPFTGSRWNRNLIELHGRSERNYTHKVSPLLLKSYAEIGEFPHEHHTWESPCRTYNRQFDYAYMLDTLYHGNGNAAIIRNPVVMPFLQCTIFTLGVSALEFNAEGTSLASGTRSGCLTLHKFESLYTHRNEPDPGKDEKKQLQHFPLAELLFHSIGVIRWNPSNKDESEKEIWANSFGLAIILCIVGHCKSFGLTFELHQLAYASPNHHQLPIFDIGSSLEVQVLRKRPAESVFNPGDISDIAFLDDTRLLASDRQGAISMWDRRVSDLPQCTLTAKRHIALTSIQLLGDQCVYGASEDGLIHIWDLRGGRSSAAFQSGTEVHSSPLESVNLASMLNEIEPLKAQANTGPLEIQCININPSCPYQLGFHFDNGWSGVLDMHNFRVSHMHCPPPPPWMVESNGISLVSPPRKPSWLPEHSIYAAPSTTNNGIHLLDFYPHSSSTCHLDYDDSKSPRETVEHKRSVYVPLSQRVTACATHPLNGAIVAGTMEASLLMISQKHLCKKGDEGDD